MAKETRDYRCVIVWKASGEEDVGYIRLDPNLNMFNYPSEPEEGILATVSSWDDIKRLGRDDNEAKFVVKRVTL